MIRWMATATAFFALLVPTAAAIACSGDRVAADMKYCLVEFPNAGRAMLLDGASERDAGKLNNGFRVCQANAPDRGTAALENWGSCSDAQKVDLAREATGKL